MSFQRTTLIEVDRMLRECYNSLGQYEEKRDEKHKIIEISHTWTNTTHQLMVRNVFDVHLWYREVPLNGIEQ